jgi:hypothetical protein
MEAAFNSHAVALGSLRRGDPYCGTVDAIFYGGHNKR